MKRPSTVVFLALTIFLGACVTINIYFPAAAAERVADEIIEDIQAEPPKPDDVRDPEARTQILKRWVSIVSRAIMYAGISTAHAAEADLSIDTPEVRKIRASMKTRFSRLQTYYDGGLIGIGSDGLISIRVPGKVPLRERTQVKQLVSKENTDRLALYQAIAKANGRAEWASDIQSTFADRWVSNARSGWWYQAADGSWAQK